MYRTAIADADTPDLPVPFDNVLSLYVLYRSYQQQEDAAMGQQYYSQFIQELDNLRARFEDSPAPQPLMLNSYQGVTVAEPKSYLPGQVPLPIPLGTVMPFAGGYEGSPHRDATGTMRRPTSRVV